MEKWKRETSQMKALEDKTKYHIIISSLLLIIFLLLGFIFWLDRYHYPQAHRHLLKEQSQLLKKLKEQQYSPRKPSSLFQEDIDQFDHMLDSPSSADDLAKMKKTLGQLKQHLEKLERQMERWQKGELNKGKSPPSK